MDKLLTAFCVAAAAATIMTIVYFTSAYYSNKNKLLAEAKTCEAAVMLQEFDVTTRLLICRLGGKAGELTSTGSKQ